MKNLYGTMNIPEKDLDSFLKKIWDSGYNWIDTAWIYGGWSKDTTGGNSTNEIKIGRALESLGDSVDFKIQTKIWPQFYRNVRSIFHSQLLSLGVKRVDSLLLHRPSRRLNDDILAWKELVKLKEEGLVDSIGVSNYDKDIIQILFNETGVMPEINQVELSLLNMREDRVKYALHNNIEIQAWSPFSKDPQKLFNNEIVIHMANKYQTTTPIIVLSYLRSKGIVPVIGTIIIEEAITNLEVVNIVNDDIKLLDSINEFDNKFSESFE